MFKKIKTEPDQKNFWLQNRILININFHSVFFFPLPGFFLEVFIDFVLLSLRSCLLCIFFSLDKYYLSPAFKVKLCFLRLLFIRLYILNICLSQCFNHCNCLLSPCFSSFVFLFSLALWMQPCLSFCALLSCLLSLSCCQLTRTSRSASLWFLELQFSALVF